VTAKTDRVANQRRAEGSGMPRRDFSRAGLASESLRPGRRGQRPTKVLPASRRQSRATRIPDHRSCQPPAIGDTSPSPP
jgi:hypothetical protein